MLVYSFLLFLFVKLCFVTVFINKEEKKLGNFFSEINQYEFMFFKVGVRFFLLNIRHK